MEQQLMMQIQMLSQEAEKIEQHIQLMDQQGNELQEIRKSLEEIKSGPEKQEILANLGKGILIKAEVKSKELFVNIGRDVVIKKSPVETLEIIDNQLLKLGEGREELIKRIQDIQQQVQQLLIQARASDKCDLENHQHSDECGCEDDCECENDCEGSCGEDCKCGHKH